MGLRVARKLRRVPRPDRRGPCAAPRTRRPRRFARQEAAHVVGLSILSGSHVPLVKDVAARMKEAGLDGVPLVVGGIIPPEDAQALQKAGVAAIYTPKDFDLNRIMADIVRIVERNGVKQQRDLS